MSSVTTLSNYVFPGAQIFAARTVTEANLSYAPLFKLPNEVLWRIVGFLDPFSLAESSLVSTLFQSLGSDPIVRNKSWQHYNPITEYPRVRMMGRSFGEECLTNKLWLL